MRIAHRNLPSSFKLFDQGEEAEEYLGRNSSRDVRFREGRCALSTALSRAAGLASTPEGERCTPPLDPKLRVAVRIATSVCGH